MPECKETATHLVHSLETYRGKRNKQFEYRTTHRSPFEYAQYLTHIFIYTPHTTASRDAAITEEQPAKEQIALAGLAA